MRLFLNRGRDRTGRKIFANTERPRGMALVIVNAQGVLHHSKIFSTYAKEEDILQMFTRVIRMVNGMESRYNNRTRQLPEITTTLTKRFFFYLGLHLPLNMLLLALIIMVNIVDVDGIFVENLDDVIQREKRANPADVVGIGVLSTVQNAGLGTYLSTWLPELLDNKCNQHGKLKLCRLMCHWSGCRHNDGDQFNDTCCMDGFKSQCCYKPLATNIQKREKLEVNCVKFGIIDRVCNYYPCWLSSPWTALNCFCRPEKKGMKYEYCATECVSRKTLDIHCPWECCVQFFGLHCGCCDGALAKHCDSDEMNKPWPTSEKNYIIEPDPVTNMISSVEKCKTIVEKHCHCRWAMCHKRNGWGASLCCPDGYDLVCCTNESLIIEIGSEDMESDEIIIANFNQLIPATKSMYGNISCTRTVEKYCPCRWAICVERYGDVFAASICCDMGYDVVCCLGIRKSSLITTTKRTNSTTASTTFTSDATAVRGLSATFICLLQCLLFGRLLWFR